jgi:hypothetical protein
MYHLLAKPFILASLHNCKFGTYYSCHELVVSHRETPALGNCCIGGCVMFDYLELRRPSEDVVGLASLFTSFPFEYASTPQLLLSSEHFCM